MNRREFIASVIVGESTLIAGCSGDRNTDTQTPMPTPASTQTSTSSPTATESPTPSESPTATLTPAPEFSLSSVDLSDEDAKYKLHVRYNARTQQSANPDGMTGGHVSSEGEKLLVVHMSVKNIGKSDIDLVGSIFGLEVDRRDENIPFNHPIGDEQIGDVLLQPDENQNGWLLTSIPAEITEGRVVAEQNQYYRANYGSSLHVEFEEDDSMEIGMETL